MQSNAVDGVSLCRILNSAIVGQPPPKRLSTDNDPLFEFHRWAANLRVLDAEKIKTVPHVPDSHLLIERLTGTIRRKYFDHALFWNAVVLMRRLNAPKSYYSGHRAHSSIDGETPYLMAGASPMKAARIDDHAWQSHCFGLYELPMAA